MGQYVLLDTMPLLNLSAKLADRGYHSVPYPPKPVPVATELAGLRAEGRLRGAGEPLPPAVSSPLWHLGSGVTAFFWS